MRRTYEPLPLSEAALVRVERAARALYAGSYAPRALAEAVAALSRVYTRERGELVRGAANKEALLARAAFFLPRDLPKVFGPLDELARVERMPARETLRVLDVGAGLGATSLGLARWLRLRRWPSRALEVVAIEQSASALAGFRELARGFAELPEEFAALALTPRAADICAGELPGGFDLVLFGFVLNELWLDLPAAERAEARADLLCRASQQLRAPGAIVVLEPASKESARELMQVRDVLAARGRAPFVIAPCLHARGCPMLAAERDWCHQELAYALPPALAAVARDASLRYEGLSYASLALANLPRPAPDAPLVRIVSDPIASKGKLELFGCSEAGYRRLTRLSRDASEANAAFGQAQRGHVLELDDATRVRADTRVKRH